MVDIKAVVRAQAHRLGLSPQDQERAKNQANAIRRQNLDAALHGRDNIPHAHDQEDEPILCPDSTPCDLLGHGVDAGCTTNLCRWDEK